MATKIFCDYGEDGEHAAALKVTGWCREGPNSASWASTVSRDTCSVHVSIAADEIVAVTKAGLPAENGWYVRIEPNGEQNAR